jgi:O-antigen biosynthesis protein
VYHHRRSTVRGYLHQQHGYGKAERMLAGRFRHRFNRLGQARWTGRIYGSLAPLRFLLRPLVYHGSMGLEPYQGIVRPRAEDTLLYAGALLPLLLPLALLGLLAPVWHWLLAAPALAVAFLCSYAAAAAAAARPVKDEPRRLRFRLLVAALHVAQPFVRFWGRATGRSLSPLEERAHEWDGDRVRWLEELRRRLSRRGSVRAGGPHADWDLEIRTGPLLACRLTAAVAWRWFPVARIALRPRPLLAALAAAGIAAAVLRPAIGISALALLATAAIGEGLIVRRRVLRALAETTRAVADEAAAHPAVRRRRQRAVKLAAEAE